jgi:hypothetical protein
MLLAISGQKGSGKDTASDMFVDKSWPNPNCDNVIVKIAFADIIKRQAQEIFGFTYEQLWGPSELRSIPDKKTGIIPRDVLKEFGDAGRKIYLNVWADYTLNAAKKIIYEKYYYKPDLGYYFPDFERLSYPSVTVIISDLRMRNELEVVKKAGGKTIRIKRGKINKTDNHISESEQLEISDSDFDYIIDNSGTLEDLEIAVNNCYKTLCIS